MPTENAIRCSCPSGARTIFTSPRIAQRVRVYIDGRYEFLGAKEVAYGGNAGTGGSDAECPFVVRRDDGYFYLFRTSQVNAPCKYCPGVTTYVYASTDPTDFGINDDSKLIAELPIAAPEIHTVNGVDYIARLLESVQGIQVCELRWQASR